MMVDGYEVSLLQDLKFQYSHILIGPLPPPPGQSAEPKR